MGKSPLLADFIHTRACKPICAKLLTLPVFKKQENTTPSMLRKKPPEEPTPA